MNFELIEFFSENSIPNIQIFKKFIFCSNARSNPPN